ncbi:hypothetical protein GCM10023191_074690 [Actinoallomurus oryzae]|uniref:Uncharacterized protein n=1 Tax=Actinoallomurus oryzae TaxID=502180 RepID=A0ABP8QVE5_9ACTN
MDGRWTGAEAEAGADATAGTVRARRAPMAARCLLMPVILRIGARRRIAERTDLSAWPVRPRRPAKIRRAGEVDPAHLGGY